MTLPASLRAAVGDTPPAPAALGATPGQPSPHAAVHVAALHVYPIKALGGVTVEAAAVGALGLHRDRRWMLVDADGAALTQREVPTLVRLATALVGNDAVRVTAPGGASCEIGPADAGAPRRPVTLFGAVIEAATFPAAVDAWFSAAAGVPCALVHLPDEVVRPVDPDYAGPDDRAAFADGYPVLVATEASLADLNARLAAKGAPAVSMARFRPNVVLAGDVAPYAEDGWRTLHVGARDAADAGAVALQLVKPCARCVVTTVDPATGAKGQEPLRTLAEYRRRGAKVLFAQNALVRGSGVMRQGDPVRVTS